LIFKKSSFSIGSNSISIHSCLLLEPLNTIIDRAATMPESESKAAVSSERDSSPHARYRDANGSDPPGIDTTKGSTGVIYTTEQADKYGFSENPSEWANLGNKTSYKQVFVP